MGLWLTAETLELARMALEHRRTDILLNIPMPVDERDRRLVPILAALKELDEYAPFMPLGVWTDEMIDGIVEEKMGYTGTGAYVRSGEAKELMKRVRDDMAKHLTHEPQSSIPRSRAINATYCCPQCGGELELIDDSGRGDGMQPDPWCTWYCESCRWEAGWAKAPDLADRLLERKVAEAWDNYDCVFPSEFPPPAQKRASLTCDKCGWHEAAEQVDGHLLCDQCVRDKADCL